MSLSLLMQGLLAGQSPLTVLRPMSPSLERGIQDLSSSVFKSAWWVEKVIKIP